MRRPSPLRRGAPLRPGSARLERWEPLRAVNPRRRAQRLERDFAGPYADWIRSLPCTVSGCRNRSVEAAHAKSRGAGGRAQDLAPLCRYHHRLQHGIGIRTFEARFGVDLAGEAAHLWASYWSGR